MVGKSKKWILKEQNTALALEMAEALKIRPIIAQILINRGIDTISAGRAFFSSDLADTPDPFLMSGMDEAVSRVQEALANKEKIVVYGDYDADGQTATALLVSSLRELAPNPDTITYYLPDRFEEGYGLNQEALATLSKTASLLITVDCGISSQAEIEYAQGLGLDIIITDHHEPGRMLPPAVAILNPKQEKCNYPFKHLAGVGVALKLVQGLKVPNWEDHLDLVALGTVADIVPLEQENRILVSYGLKSMAMTSKPGLKALLEVADVVGPKSSDLGFRLGPRLNAGGRLGEAARGVRLLLTHDLGEAMDLAAELSQENARRQDLEAEVLEAAMEMVETYNLYDRSALVVWGEGWHQGVVGIVASRLVERYYLPTVVLSVADGQATASARSIPGLDLYQTLGSCSRLLSKFGGHAMAAGLRLPAENLRAFQTLFEELCAAKLSPEDYVPKLHIDGTTKLEDVSEQLIEELRQLEPHGYGNPGPLLQAEVTVLNTRRVGAQNNHLKMTVQDETAGEVSAIAFSLGHRQEQIERHAESLAVAFVPELNEWRNEKTVQLNIKEWEPRGHSTDYVKRWMVDLYPWRLGASYFQSGVLNIQSVDARAPKSFRFVDLRGTWDKEAILRERSGMGQEPEAILILVNTPASVLALCRELRIKTPQGSSFIGFEHEWMSTEERREFEGAQPRYVVSTGLCLEGYTWQQILFWEPPLTKEMEAKWLSLLQDGGELVGVYGPKDVRNLQGYLVQNYPDRRGLARIYTTLKAPSGAITMLDAYERLESMGMLGALPVAMGLFLELGLWEVEEQVIRYLKAPSEKLDLEQTVLYNKVTKMRQQSEQYLKHCLERGFFQDGLKKEN